MLLRLRAVVETFVRLDVLFEVFFAVVVVVVGEHLLNRTFPKEHCVFLKKLLILLASDVLLDLSKIEIILLAVGNEGRGNCFIIKIISLEVFESDVRLQLIRACLAQPLYGLPLYQLVYEVSCFIRSSHRDFFPPQLHLSS